MRKDGLAELMSVKSLWLSIICHNETTTHYGKVLQLCGCPSSDFLTMAILFGNVDRWSSHIWKTARLGKAEHKYGFSNHKEEPLFKTDVTGVLLIDTLIDTHFSQCRLSPNTKFCSPPPQGKGGERGKGDPSSLPHHHNWNCVF